MKRAVARNLPPTAALAAVVLLISFVPSSDGVFTSSAANTGNVLAAAFWAAVGDEHTCTVVPDNTVWCWGDNDNGQLGNATTTDSTTPVQVVGAGGTGLLGKIGRVSAGDNHTCALRVRRRIRLAV